MEGKKIGFDTGFFIKILQNNKTAVNVWIKIQNNKAVGFVSILSIFEIKRLMLKGAIDKKTTEILLNDLSNSCNIIMIDDEDILQSAAKISHGYGIPAIDSLILSSLHKSGISVLYTTDKHMCKYNKKDMKIIRLL